MPTRGPGSAHSGVNAWVTNLTGNYNNNEDGSITSPVIDLSAGANQILVLSWWQWLQTESGYDFASVEISSTAGISWTVVYTTSGIVNTEWTKVTLMLDSVYATSGFQVRFRLNRIARSHIPDFT